MPHLLVSKRLMSCCEEFSKIIFWLILGRVQITCLQEEIPFQKNLKSGEIGSHSRQHYYVYIASPRITVVRLSTFHGS